MKRIALLTSGGDAPGMNAAIRAVVRTGLAKGWDLFGGRHGYAGLISGDVVPLGARDVGGIIQQGGTMLGSARCPEFKTADGRLQALSQLRRHGIEALVVIGGNRAAGRRPTGGAGGTSQGRDRGDSADRSHRQQEAIRLTFFGFGASIGIIGQGKIIQR